MSRFLTRLNLVFVLWFVLLSQIQAATDCTIVTEIPQSQCETLISFYNSTKGDNWKNSEGWDAINTPCDWHGVKCENGEVTQLSLTGNNLTGVLPDLSALDGLQVINLISNELSGDIPELNFLTNLQGISLSVNNLTGNIPDLNALENLQLIQLYDNKLSGPIPNLSALTKLEILSLGKNQLSGAIPDLANLINLQVLLLDNNQLTGNIPDELADLTQLESLVLGDNQLTGSIPDLSQLTNLKTLSLDNNQLSGSIPDLSTLVNLQTLELHRNQLTGTIPNLETFINLKEINLSNNQLSGSIPDLSLLENLRVLYLSHNQLIGTIPDLSSLTNVQSIYLFNNQLDGAIPDLDALVDLNNLWLGSNQLCRNADANYAERSEVEEFPLCTTEKDELTVNEDQIASLSQDDLEQIYIYQFDIGKVIETTLTESVPSNRSQPVDLWVSVTNPNGENFFLTDLVQESFSLEPQPFKTSVDVAETIHPLRLFIDEFPQYLDGEYTFSALYVALGKNPFTDGIEVYQSNPVVETTMIYDVSKVLPNQEALTVYLEEQFGENSVSIENQDISVTIDGEEIHYGQLAEPIKLVTPPTDGQLIFKLVDDANNDGIDDFLITYPNGDQQVLYYFETEKPLRYAGYFSIPAPNQTLHLVSSGVGLSVTEDITITETGEADLNIDFIMIEGSDADDFRVLTDLPLTIADGEVIQTITVQCTPSEAGTRTAQLQLSSNDPNQPTIIYELACAVQLTTFRSSPVHGEGNVAVTRETILEFSRPLAEDTVIDDSILFAEFGGQRLSARLHLSPDRHRVTLFYQNKLPASARIRVKLDTRPLRDDLGQPIEVDGDRETEDSFSIIDFDTLTLTTEANTSVCGRVFASELAVNTRSGQSLDVPLEGVTITVDGMEATLRTGTDASGNFCLTPAPAGRFFVHIDGRTATNGVSAGAYYPFVGKAWESKLGDQTNIGNIYLPLVTAGTLQPVSETEETVITFSETALSRYPNLAGVSITVPTDSLYADDGTRGGKVGIAPVPPDRIPGQLPPGLDFPIVITVQTNGATNFDAPVPACFPNLPNSDTGEPLPTGSKSALWSFNHDTGKFEVIGPMTVSADGQFVCTDPGVGIRAPGWHGSQPGTGGEGGPILEPVPPVNESETPPSDESGSQPSDELEPPSGDPESPTDEPPEPPSDEEKCQGITYDPVTECCGNEGPVPKINESCPAENKEDCQGIAYDPATECCGNEGIFPKIADNCPKCRSQIFNPATQCCGKKGPFPKVDGDCLKCGSQVYNPAIQCCLSSVSHQIGIYYYTRNYNPATQCCNKQGLSDKYNVTDLSKCPNRIPRPGYEVPNPNGCGPSWLNVNSIKVPPADFLPACNGHDTCWGTFNKDLPGHKERCDESFHNQMREICVATFNNVEQESELEECLSEARGFFNWVLRGGIVYNNAQEKASLCCPCTGQRVGQRAGRTNNSYALSEGLHYFALINWFTGDVVQRGVTGSNGIAHKNLNLAANTMYRHWILKAETLSVGYSDFITPDSGNRFQLPTTFLDTSTSPDSDGDGLHDDGEFVLGTDPNNPDSDGDGILDGAEIQQGTNPLDGIPAATGIIATADTPGTAVDICAINDMAFIADLRAGISIFNVFDRLAPTIIAQVNTPGKAQAVTCASNLVAVADGPTGLAIIDITDPPAAQIVHQVALNGSAQSVAVAGNMIYVGTTSGQLALVDLNSGTLLNQINVGNAIQDVAIGGDTLYVLTINELHTLSLLASNLKIAHSVSSPGSMGAGRRRFRLFIGEKVAYAAHTQGYNTFDLTSPLQPTLIAAGNTQQFGWKQIVDNGSGLGIAAVSPNNTNDGQHHISLYDVSNPAETNAFITQFETPGLASAVSIYNGLAYVADSTAGLQVINYLAYDAQGVPPTIDLSTSLVANEVEEGKVMRVTASVNDDVQVRNVAFYIDDEKVVTDGNFPFEHRFITPSLAQQENLTIRACASDTGGNSTCTDDLLITITPDATPPDVTDVSPLEGSIALADTINAISATFNEPIAPETLNENTLRLFGAGADGEFGNGDDVPITDGIITYYDETNTVFLTFDSPLSVNNYRATLSPAVTDIIGNPLPTELALTFRIADPSDVFWTGTSGDWHDPDNWSTKTVPSPTDNVLIQLASDETISISRGEHHINNLHSEEKIVFSGGTLQVTDTIQVNNEFILSGGTLIGATVLAGKDGQGITAQRGTLDDVTMDADLKLNNDKVYSKITILNGLTLNSTATLGLDDTDYSGYLDFEGNQTLDGTGIIVLGNYDGYYGNYRLVNGLRVKEAQTTLTIGSEITIRGTDGFIGYSSHINGGSQEVAFINHGLISADVENGTITLHGNDWSNDGGTLEATNGTIRLEGIVDNRNKTLSLSGSGAILLQGAIIQGGNITGVKDAKLTATNNGTLDNVTMDTDLNLASKGVYSKITVQNGLTLNSTATLGLDDTDYSGYLDFEGNQTLDGTGIIVLGNYDGYYGNYRLVNGLRVKETQTTLTIGSEITIRGTDGFIGYSSHISGGSQEVAFINHGLISADVENGIITLHGNGWSNDGGTLEATNGTIRLEGIVDNRNKTLSLSGSGSILLQGATIQGGNITGVKGAKLTATNSGTLDDVTMNTDLNLASKGVYSKIIIQNGLTLNNTATLGLDDTDYSGHLDFEGNQTLDGTGIIVLGNYDGYYNYRLVNGLRVKEAQTTLTIGSDITIRGADGFIGYSSHISGGSQDIFFTNHGIISANVSEGIISLHAEKWTNTGTIEELNGGSIEIKGKVTNTGSCGPCP
jgi:Leucine-rich repeat (LRR) protein